MSEIREEDGSNDQVPGATEGGAVSGDKEVPGPQRDRPGDEQQQQRDKQKGKEKKKKIIRRAKTLLGSSIKRIGSSRKTNGSPCCSSSNSYPFYFGDQSIGCCYLCFLPPPPADSPPGPGGPRGNTSSYGFVKNLIERNDFYDPECNVHRDI